MEQQSPAVLADDDDDDDDVFDDDDDFVVYINDDDDQENDNYDYDNDIDDTDDDVGDNNNDVVVVHNNNGPRIVWLASYPNSGTSYTMTLIERATNKSTATNYGVEVSNKYDQQETVPIHPTYPEGPYYRRYHHGINVNDHNHNNTDEKKKTTRKKKASHRFTYRELPDQYIMTKTHCGGRCVKCLPSEYMITNITTQFLTACERTTSYRNKKKKRKRKEEPQQREREESRWISSSSSNDDNDNDNNDNDNMLLELVEDSMNSVDRVDKIIHLIRNPFHNIVARFHLERRHILEKYHHQKQQKQQKQKQMNNNNRRHKDKDTEDKKKEKRNSKTKKKKKKKERKNSSSKIKERRNDTTTTTTKKRKAQQQQQRHTRSKPEYADYHHYHHNQQQERRQQQQQQRRRRLLQEEVQDDDNDDPFLILSDDEILPNNVTGFHRWCQYLDTMYWNNTTTNEQHEHQFFFSSKVYQLMNNIQYCRSEFYKYVQWHNSILHVSQYIQREKRKRRRGSMEDDHDKDNNDDMLLLPMLTIHYEDYQNTNLVEMTTKLTSFLNQTMIISEHDQLRPFRKLPQYEDHYTKHERYAIKQLMKEVAIPETWKQIKRYFL